MELLTLVALPTRALNRQSAILRRLEQRGPCSTSAASLQALASVMSDVPLLRAAGCKPARRLRLSCRIPPRTTSLAGLIFRFGTATDNNPAGDNTAAIRAGVFNYGGNNWGINDGTGHSTTLSGSTTGAAGMSLSLTLDSATAYTLYLTPLSNPSATFTYNGTYSGTIDYVNYREYDGIGTSPGPNDTADNLEISSMSIVPEPSSFADAWRVGSHGASVFPPTQVKIPKWSHYNAGADSRSNRTPAFFLSAPIGWGVKPGFVGTAG